MWWLWYVVGLFFLSYHIMIWFISWYQLALQLFHSNIETFKLCKKNFCQVASSQPCIGRECAFVPEWRYYFRVPQICHPIIFGCHPTCPPMNQGLVTPLPTPDVRSEKSSLKVTQDYSTVPPCSDILLSTDSSLRSLFFCHGPSNWVDLTIDLT